MIAFVIAYHGSNAEITGGVKGEFWHHQKVDDVLVYLNGAFQMVLVDMMSAIISIVLLRVFCNINAFSEYNKVMTRCGVLMTVYVLFVTNTVGMCYDHLRSSKNSNLNRIALIEII